MQSLPPSTPTPAVYLMGGVVPAVAERDIQILQLVGQLAICDRSIQAVSDIVESNLGGESIDFAGWSGLARRTAAIYNLIDPLELFQNPWKSERWSKYVKGEVIKYWTNLLHENVASYPSLDMLDTSRLDLSSPHPIWLAAGTNPVSVTKATVVSWLLLNVYKTAERLHKMRKLKSPECLSCLAPVDDQVHFGLQCLSLVEIRSEYMSKFTEACPNISKYLSNPKVLLVALLDPFSPLVPNDLNNGWRNKDEAYKLSRNYFYDLHKKREKINENKNCQQTQPEEDDTTQIIINVYENI